MRFHMRTSETSSQNKSVPSGLCLGKLRYMKGVKLPTGVGEKKNIETPQEQIK
jgi:hypothetical protein